jgi:hypothetical protein
LIKQQLSGRPVNYGPGRICIRNTGGLWKENEELSVFVSGPHVEFYKYFQLFLGSTESFSGQPIIQGDNRKEINSCCFAIPDLIYFIPLACFLTQN